jgi:hypothetical protein
MPRPKKVFKSLSDDEDVTNILEVVENIDNDHDDDEKLVNDDVPSEDLETMDKDDIQVSTTGDDVSVELTSVRANRPPPKMWYDGIKTKFNTGDLVNFKGYPTAIFKVTGPSKIPFTYAIILSGTDSVRYDIPEDKLKKAKSDAIWVSHWNVVSDPYREWVNKKKEEHIPQKEVNKKEVKSVSSKNKIKKKKRK